MPGTKQFDPLAYIESAFLDTNPEGAASEKSDKAAVTTRNRAERSVKFRKTALSAPRPRRSKAEVPTGIDPNFKDLLEHLPKNVEFLGRFFSDSVTSHYYNHEFKESREEMIRRLLDPELSLEEVSRLLGVCPATVRRYTNKGWLEHHRTKGGQRRFRLSGLVRFVDKHGRIPEA